MAMSALRSSRVSSRVRSSSTAMPMLARMVTCPPTGGTGAPGAQDPLGEHAGGGQVGVLGQDGELVAAEAADGVVLAQAAAQPSRDLAQQPVAGAVAEAVVDHLEVVEVDEEHGQAAAVPAGPGQGVPDPVVEQGPVGQVGQAVVEVLVLELGG